MKDLVKPAVSVLLPCFQAARHLPRCLESLYSQTFSNFEVIAIDDGSDDETGEILAQAAKVDSRLRLWRESHRGIAATLQQGGWLRRHSRFNRGYCRLYRLLLKDHRTVILTCGRRN